MDSRSRLPARRSSFLSGAQSPYSRPHTRHVGRSISFQTPPSNSVDPIVGETSAVNNVVATTMDQVAPDVVPDAPAPETPGNAFL